MCDDTIHRLCVSLSVCHSSGAVVPSVLHGHGPRPQRLTSQASAM